MSQDLWVCGGQCLTEQTKENEKMSSPGFNYRMQSAEFFILNSFPKTTENRFVLLEMVSHFVGCFWVVFHLREIVF